MCERERIIAVDFDGCLCENAWPDIGEAKQPVIDALLNKQTNGAKLILWTCRVEERLDEAVSWCAEHGIIYKRQTNGRRGLDGKGRKA